MIEKTKGMVLSHIPYGDTSIITKIYTAQHGFQSFIVNSVRSARSKQGMSYFQPFSYLEMVIYFKETREIQRISEFRLLEDFHVTDIRKQTVLLFLAEVLEKLLRNEQEENPSLFKFLVDAIRVFYTIPFDPTFHIRFLLKLSGYLGLEISEGSAIFSNMNRVADQSEIEQLIDRTIAARLVDEIESSGDIRYRTLVTLMDYYAHHVPGFGHIQSLKVLREIFR